MAKARMYCGSVMPQLNAQGEKVAEVVSLYAVCTDDPTNPNHAFSVATPSANLTMHITREGAMGAFKQGKTYDVTFTQYGE